MPCAIDCRRNEPRVEKQHYVIVVADDDPGVNAFLSDLLRDEGYAVLSCISGEDALRVVARVRPDLVIADMQMDLHDAGLQLLARLRQNPTTATISVLLCSADRLSLGRSATQIAALGAETLAKPFDVDQLLQTVARLLLQSR